MKKTIGLLMTTILALSSYSQDESASEPNFQLGVQVSPNMSWFSPDSEGLEKEGAKIGFSFGLIADFNISKNYSFSTGINVLNMGGEIDYPDRKDVNSDNNLVGGRTTADIRMSYIQVPLTLKLKTNQIGYMTYYARLGFGLAVNYKAEADEEFNFPNATGTINNEAVDYADEISLVRTSLILNLGAEYNLSGNTSVIFGVTYDNGINNILSEDIYEEDQNENGMGERNQDFKAITNSIVLNLGIIF